MSVTVALMFFFTVYALEMVGKGVWFRPWVRGFLGDYAYPVSPLQLHIKLGSLPRAGRSPQYSGQDLLISLAS